MGASGKVLAHDAGYALASVGDVFISVYVIEGGGFGSASARTMIAGINLVIRAGHPVEVFAEPRAAAEWLASQGASAPSSGIVDAVGEARTAMSERLARRA